MAESPTTKWSRMMPTERTDHKIPLDEFVIQLATSLLAFREDWNRARFASETAWPETMGMADWAEQFDNFRHPAP